MKSSKKRFHRTEGQMVKERVSGFYRPFLDLFTEADIYRPEGKDYVCQMTGLQCVMTFVFLVLWSLGIELLHIILNPLGMIGYYISLFAMIFSFPYAIELPRFLLPWRCVEKTDFFYVRRRSKWGFILALYFGLTIGGILAAVLPEYL